MANQHTRYEARRLKVGDMCTKGLHVMKTEADIYTSRNSDYVYRTCIQCKREKDRKRGFERRQAQRDLKGSTRYAFGKYWIHFACEHANVYESPLPEPGEIVFCMKCRDYAEVVRWGAIANTLSPPGGEDGR